METTYLVVFSAVAGCLFILSVLTTLFLVNALRGMQADLDELDERAEPKAIQKALAISEGTAQRVDTAVVELGKFREGIHKEVQRLYGIMRREEKASARFEAAGQQDESEDGPDIPDQIDPEQLAGAQGEETEELSKAELRRRAREAGMRI